MMAWVGRLFSVDYDLVQSWADFIFHEWFDPSCQVQWLYRNMSLWCIYRDVFHIAHQHTRWSQGTLTYITPKRCKIIIASLLTHVTVCYHCLKKNKKKTDMQQALHFPLSTHSFKIYQFYLITANGRGGDGQVADLINLFMCFLGGVFLVFFRKSTGEEAFRK